MKKYIYSFNVQITFECYADTPNVTTPNTYQPAQTFYSLNMWMLILPNTDKQTPASPQMAYLFPSTIWNHRQTSILPDKDTQFLELEERPPKQWLWERPVLCPTNPSCDGSSILHQSFPPTHTPTGVETFPLSSIHLRQFLSTYTYCTLIYIYSENSLLELRVSGNRLTQRNLHK